MFCRAHPTPGCFCPEKFWVWERCWRGAEQPEPCKSPGWAQTKVQGKQEHLRGAVFVPRPFFILEFCWLQGAEGCVRVGAAPSGDGAPLGWLWGISVGSGGFWWAGRSCCSQGRAHPSRSLSCLCCKLIPGGFPRGGGRNGARPSSRWWP